MQNLKYLVIIFTALFASVVSASQEYHFVITVPGGISVPEPKDLRENAWANKGQEFGKTIPSDWSDGINWNRGCCATPIDTLPSELYPTILMREFSIARQHLISDLSSLSEVTEIDGGFNIRGTGVTDLTPLSGATIGGGHVRIYDLDISSLVGIEGMVDVNWVHINNNPNLQTLAGLDNLRGVGTFTLNDNNLNDISALSNLREFGYHPGLRLTGNPNLDDLSPLSGVTNFVGNTCSAGTECGRVSIDNRNYTGKIAASSAICQDIAIAKAKVVDVDGNKLDPALICES